MKCLCVCQSPGASRAFCEHCKGNNIVGNYWKERKIMEFFINRPVKIIWERDVIPQSDKIFKIIKIIELNSEIFVVIDASDNYGKAAKKESLIRLSDIRSITLI